MIITFILSAVAGGLVTYYLRAQVEAAVAFIIGKFKRS